MDVYGGLLVDDLLNLPNDEFFSSSPSSSSSVANTAVSEFLHHHPSSAAAANYYDDSPVPTYSTDFTDALFIPTDDAAELEWVSNYMDDTFTDFPESALSAVTSGNFHHKNSSAFHGRARSKRSRPSTSTTGVNPKLNGIGIENVRKRENFITAGENEEVARRCSHCASEKTPQWRTGPFGPKTLCNACGVRYKSGRLVPEYRPAASPTFVLTQHSNSHRKVMELRRQKEMFQHHSLQLHQ